MRAAAALALAFCCVATSARAQDLKDRFNIRLSLTGMYLTEQEAAATPETQQSSGGLSLGYFEARSILDARRLPGKFELHLDGRARITPSEYGVDQGYAGASQTIARGYFGGREYEIKQAWARRRGERIDFAVGRLVVAEADALRLDGGRLWARLGKHWDVSTFVGAYPNPFSRSITTDYNGFTFAGGADSSYTYDKIWGSFSAVGSFLGGQDAGGPLPPGITSALSPRSETPRVWFTWTQFVRLTSWLDLFNDLVIDATGSAGAQLTRADLLASLRAGKVLTFRLGYDHLSSLAIEMYLFSLLNNRATFLANTIENNLIVERTARDEGRLQADASFGKVSIFAEGRVRHRGPANGGADPLFGGVYGAGGIPTLALDGTIGARDRGTLGGVRLGTWLSYLADYRGTSIIFDLDVGRAFLDERLTVDAAFLYARTKDAGAGQPCNPIPPMFTPLALLQTCTGARDGAEYELGLTVTGQPWKHWFGLLDYRLVIDETGGRPNILTHMILLRAEARY